MILSLCMGTPEHARVTQHLCPLLGPQEGRGKATTSNFVPLFGYP